MSAHVSLKWIHKSALCDINILPYIDLPVITNHPNNDSVPIGGSATLMCSGTGDVTLGYSWERSSGNDTSVHRSSDHYNSSH